MENGFDKTLNLTKFSFLLSGINIEHSDNRLWTRLLEFLFYFNLIWLYTDVFGEFFWLIEGIHLGKSFTELSLIAPCTTICILGTAKCTPLFYYRHSLIKVIEKLRNMHPKFDEEDSYNDDNKTEPEKDFNEENGSFDTKESEQIVRKIVKDSVKFLNIVIMLLYYSAVVVVFVFTMLPLMLMGYEFYMKGETDLKLPFLVKYFFNPFTKFTWPLVYIHQIWSTVVVANNVFSADTFHYTFCTYIQMHFLILSHRFEHFVALSSTETRERLSVLVKRHQELIKLVDEVEMITSKGTLFNIVSSSVLICLSGFNVTFSDENAAVIAYVTFLMLNISQISLLCLFGDMLSRSSTTVSAGIWKSRWYDADSGIKKSVFLILMRSQKPCRLTAANFADLNLSAFTTILSRSWSYFALLRTVYK